MFVQFSDETKKQVISVFLGPQDETCFPNQGELPEDDPRYLKFIGADQASVEASLYFAIDSAANAARTTVVGDPLMVVEYDRAAAQARAYIAADYVGDVPAMVAAYAINGRTPKEAADKINAKADKYEGALTQLRAIRLSAKEQIRAWYQSGSEQNINAAKVLAESAVLAIQDVVVGVGSNA